MEKSEAETLLLTHTNKITANKSLVCEIHNSSPSNIKYTNIKQEIYHILHNLPQIPICQSPTCDTLVSWDKRNQRYTTYCGYECSNSNQSQETKQKRTKTNIDRYGGNAPACSEDVRQLMKNTNIDRYGDQYTTLTASKSKKAIYVKYGVNNISELDAVKQKKIQTSLTRYGTKYPNQSPEILERRVNTCLAVYNRKSHRQIGISDLSYATLINKDSMVDLHITKKNSVAGMALQLGVSKWTIYNYLNLHDIENQNLILHTSCSVGQQELITFLTDNGVQFEVNNRSIISPLELDIYLPEFKLAIEYNGLYWHSEKNNKTSNYHKNKTELCEAQNIRLIHIFEDEWNFQKQQCKDTILHLLGRSERGIFARNTTIKSIPWVVARDFLDTYHLLKAGKSGNYRIGAFDPDGNLIGVMVFGKQNNEGSDANVVELRRFVTNKKNNPGLGSKMFKYAVQQQGYTSIVAFVDRRWFTGLVKSYIGFTLVGVTAPALWWTNGRIRKHRRFITKTKLVSEGYSSALSKHHILDTLGYYRIWDCGKLKLRWDA